MRGTGSESLSLPMRLVVWTQHVLATRRDKGLARLHAESYGGDARIQRVFATSLRLAKNDGSRSVWVDPQDPPSGIMRRTLRRILTRRASFGGRKGRRAAVRLKEMSR